MIPQVVVRQMGKYQRWTVRIVMCSLLAAVALGWTTVAGAFIFGSFAGMLAVFELLRAKVLVVA